jgi:fatty-acyl-CoA synthase
MTISRAETQNTMDILRDAQIAVAARSNWLVPDVLEKQVQDRPDAISLIYAKDRYTWAELDEKAAHYAKVALACGVKPGDCCAVMVENRPEFLFAWLGLCKIGAIPALINTQTRDKALAHAISITSASIFLVGEECLGQLDQTQLTSNPSLSILVIRDPEQEVASERPNGVELLSEIDIQSSLEPDFTALRSGIKNTATCCYIFTSGTTGLPKAALISHGKYLSAGAGYIAALGLSNEDVFYCALPMFHGAALMSLFGTAIQIGGATVLCRKFSVSRFWKDVQENQITVFQYVGEVCRYLVNAPPVDEENSHRLRLLLGAGMGIDVWHRFQERFGTDIRIVEGWGATEANGNMINFDQKPGACGRIPFPEKSHLTLLRYDQGTDELVRDENGRYVRSQVGEVGEMHCQIHTGTGVIVAPFDGYTSTEATQSKILRDVFEPGDAWFKSGDIFRYDEEGYFFFVDRVGDTFRWKGENVSTTEVAQQLSRYPDIETINIYGVKIPEHEGRACMAAITLKPGCHLDPQAFYRFVVSQLPAYARPLFVRILPDADLTANFKLRKVRLREEGFDLDRITDRMFGLDTTTQSYEALDSARVRALTSPQRR